MKIDRKTWLAAGICGAMVGLIPMIIFMTILKDGFDFDILSGLRPMFLGLLFGSFGGAYVYHRMTFARNNKQ